MLPIAKAASAWTDQKSSALTPQLIFCESALMPRPLRIEYEGALYHATSRGDRREAIFLDDQDKSQFLRTFEQACLKAGWQVHAYCLMTNHFHLVLETPQPNLALGMKWLLGERRRATPSIFGAPAQ